MPPASRVVAFTWHQRTSPIETRERLLEALASGPDRALLATCHRVEIYAAIPRDADAADFARALGLANDDRAAMTIREGAAAVQHLFSVAAGLDSAVVGEPQILGQVRRAYASTSHPMLVAVLGRALHVGRVVRSSAGLSSARSVGSLAVDALLAAVPSPHDATIVVIGAGEMGKLAIRALARRVQRVIVANRDRARGASLAEVHGAQAIALEDVPNALDGAAGVISAADTRGTVLTARVLAARACRGPLAVVDIAVPRSLDADARAVLGTLYRSVDDLPGARSVVPAGAIDDAQRRCAAEADRFVRERAAESGEAIRALRARAETLRAAKLERAMRRLGHLSERDRRIVTALSETITHALLHAPTVAIRERAIAVHADPDPLGGAR